MFSWALKIVGEERRFGAYHTAFKNTLIWREGLRKAAASLMPSVIFV